MLLLLVFVICPRGDASPPVYGKAVHVASGNRLTVLTEGRLVRLKLAGIDVPAP